MRQDRHHALRCAMFSAQIAALRACLMLLKNANYLLVRESSSLHLPSLFLGRTLIQTGGNSQLQVIFSSLSEPA